MSRLARQLRSRMVKSPAPTPQAAEALLPGTPVSGASPEAVQAGAGVMDSAAVSRAPAAAGSAAVRSAPPASAAGPAAAPLTPPAAGSGPLALAEAWFARRGWQVFPFQREVWQAVLAGHSGLLHATTGAGKTYAAWFAAMLRSAANRQPGWQKQGLRVLWITPMRALAADTLRSLQAAQDVLPAWTVAARTGDTSSTERARQARRLPEALVTTPESLSLMLSRPDAQEHCAQLDMIVVDEWHELVGNKRGVQVQLALARLRRWRPGLPVWGLSATLGNLERALHVLTGHGAGIADAVIVEGATAKDIVVDTLVPQHPSRFPWAGHLGLSMLPRVAEEIERHAATPVFTNTRSQAELWYQNLLEARPDWAGLVALHHGSLDKAVREWVEQGLKEGRLKAVVCTSSLDLGVDFLPVERVLQVGSAKGVARLLQRAGRSGHAPGRPSRVTLVPTHSLELLEAAAAKQAVRERRIEARTAPDKPLDVLVQHLVTIAAGGGFVADELKAEVRSAWSYRDLSDDEWQWALDFTSRGGRSLTAYPEYHRVQPDEHGVWRVRDAAIARRHRMNIGTIVADASMQVQYLRGARLGTVEEAFIARLKPGDHFLFGGRILEFVRVHEMTAYVRRAQRAKGAVPRWQGGRMPLSSELAQAVLAQLRQAGEGVYDGPEMQAVRPLLAVQQRWSSLPGPHVAVVESLQSREGHHVFLYPFAGRAVHTGLASLLAWRLAQARPATFSMAVNDYGLELLAPEPFDWPGAALFDDGHLLEHVLASLNAAELSQRRFRDIARIAGLVFQGYPGGHKSARQLQASSSLFFDVFRKHDAGNLLLTQAQREVLEQELELGRLRATLQDLQRRAIVFHTVARATPFGFALMVERFREKLSTEKLADRVARMLRELEKAAGPEPDA